MVKRDQDPRDLGKDHVKRCILGSYNEYIILTNTNNRVIGKYSYVLGRENAFICTASCYFHKKTWKADGISIIL